MLSSLTRSFLDQDLRSRAANAVLRESEALRCLAHKLPPDFEKVVHRLGELQGKVVFSGVGKSGYIARKVASTLSSVGTPACFLHPTEANHGDLGLLTVHDALILFSNSGESTELAPLIQYAHRLRILLVAITSCPESSLARAANATLLLPRAPEVCPLGLAPTTSALLMLALGDALAVCLLQLKHFSAQEYRLRHPGGALGRHLLKVSDIMRRGGQLPVAPRGTTMADALLVMTQKACGCLGVVDPDSQKLLGIVTDGDLRRHMSAALLSQEVEAVMTPDPFMIQEDALVADALTLMNERQITVLFACNDAHEMTGLIHLHDCLKTKIY